MNFNLFYLEKGRSIMFVDERQDELHFLNEEDGDDYSPDDEWECQFPGKCLHPSVDHHESECYTLEMAESFHSVADKGFNPDWSLPEATQESLRDHMALLKAAQESEQRFREQVAAAQAVGIETE